MRYHSISLLVLLGYSFFSISQLVPAMGMGAYSRNHIDVSSFTSNQACLAQINRVSSAVYVEKRFLMSELNEGKLVAALPTNSGNFGLSAQYFGSGVYHASQVGLAYARRLHPGLDLGIQFNYHRIAAMNVGHASTVTIDAGTIIHLSEKFHAGIHLANPIGGKFSKGIDDRIPFIYTAGFGYDASGKFLVSAEIIKAEDQAATVSSGFQYKVIPQILIRAGISTAAPIAWFGIGFQLTALRLDMYASYHPQLGTTPGLLLLFGNQKKSNDH